MVRDKKCGRGQSEIKIKHDFLGFDRDARAKRGHNLLYLSQKEPTNKSLEIVKSIVSKQIPAVKTYIGHYNGTLKIVRE